MSVVAEPLPKSMPAVVAHGPGDYRFEDRPVPKPGPGPGGNQGQERGHLRERYQVLYGRTNVLGRRSQDRILPASGNTGS